MLETAGGSSDSRGTKGGECDAHMYSCKKSAIKAYELHLRSGPAAFPLRALSCT